MQLSRIWDRLRSSLWFRPGGWLIVFGALAFILTAVDRQTGGVYVEAGLPWYFRGGPEGARTILSIIGGGVLTVTSLTFSIIMVAVVQTANAYSPRILNGYLAEPAHQHVLGILVGTFLYTLLVLWEVRSVEDGVHVPSLSITGAIVLSLVSVGSFIYFIHYVSHSISVGNVVSLIMDDTENTLDRLFPENVGEAWQKAEEPVFPSGGATTLEARSSGYVAYIDGGAVIAAAREADAVVVLRRTIGEYVFHGVPLATVWHVQGDEASTLDKVHNAFQLGKERELRQDFLFGVRQLTDIALRALSPGINDPSTAEQCIDALVNLLSKFTRHTPVSPYRCDEEGALRLIARNVTLERVLEMSFSKIRNYLGGDVSTTIRLISACGELGYATQERLDREALWSEVVMIAHQAQRNVLGESDRITVNEALWRAGEILGRDAQPILLKTAPS